MLAAQLERRSQPVVLVVGRHLDVDYGYVGPVCARPSQEILCVPGLSHDLEACALEYPRDALAQEDVVLADHDAKRHGLTLLPLAGPSEQSPQLAAREVVLGDEPGRSHGLGF